MKRYLCVWFPDWPLDRLRRTKRARARAKTPRPCGAPAETPRPFALYEAGAGGLRIAVANAPARAGGVTAGLTLSAANARVSDLTCEEIDRASDRAALARLAAWMIRYTPIVAIQGEDTLMLETTGCDHLFGGETAMAGEISGHLAQAGLGHRIGLAATPGAACALALGAEATPAILEDGETRMGLAGLPVGALRLSGETVRLLRRFGLTRIGQLYRLERKALARRFASRVAADAVLVRLDQALGRICEPLHPVRPPPTRVARLACPEPLLHEEGVRAGLARLAETLCQHLTESGEGARDVTLNAFRADASVSAVTVSATRPVRNPDHLLTLFRENGETVDPGFGIDLMMLEARRTGPMETAAPALSPDLAAHDVDEAALSQLADRITARLGPGTVRVITAHARHMPMRAARQTAYQGQLADWSAPRPDTAPRPLRLFDPGEPVDVLAEVPDGPPLRLVWRGVARRVVRADGAERIAPEWWAETSGARSRDYYRIEDGEGRRYWVFRDGLYGDGRGGTPRWYVQGVFT